MMDVLAGSEFKIASVAMPSSSSEQPTARTNKKTAKQINTELRFTFLLGFLENILILAFVS